MLADSHIHLFENGYKDSGEDEIALYEELMQTYSIHSAVVIGYEGEPWAQGNNAYIASLAKTRPWLHSLAFVQPENLCITYLENFLPMGFEGITLYIFSHKDLDNLKLVNESVWQWLISHRWIVSVNSMGNCWEAWFHTMSRFPTLSLLISHLGLPTVTPENASVDRITSEFAAIKKLCQFENTYLKLSGFYALEPSKPTYPYPTLDRYLKYIVENFDIERLIWGSDFSPALSAVTFPQTFQHFSDSSFLTPGDLTKIMTQNLMNLLLLKPDESNLERIN
jgi:predicted TIM-barrel fold metal-dependent hydrolase